MIQRFLSPGRDERPDTEKTRDKFSARPTHEKRTGKSTIFLFGTQGWGGGGGGGGGGGAVDTEICEEGSRKRLNRLKFEERSKRGRKDS